MLDKEVWNGLGVPVLIFSILQTFTLVISLLNFNEESLFSQTKPLPVTNLCFLHMKSSKDTQSNSRTSITHTCFRTGAKAFVTDLRTWRAYFNLTLLGLLFVYAPWVAQGLKSHIGSNEKKFLWLSCGFCSKNTLSSSVPQACKWARSQFAFHVQRYTWCIFTCHPHQGATLPRNKVQRVNDLHIRSNKPISYAQYLTSTSCTGEGQANLAGAGMVTAFWELALLIVLLSMLEVSAQELYCPSQSPRVVKVSAATL